MVRKQDQIYGCLLGAAAGDALGFCVEDLTLADIREKYGPGGIQGYDTVNGFATISSHTQLSMFTANGLLFGATRGATRGVMAPYVQYLEAAYRDWSKTQHYGSWKNRENAIPGYAPWRSCTAAAIRSLLSCMPWSVPTPEP